MPQLRIDDLPRHLQRSLAPVYLIAGEEPLLIEEALSQIRTAGRAAGYAEREVLHADGGFDWSLLRQAADTLSLFGDRRLLELRLGPGAPGQPGARALQEYCKAPPGDTLLLVVAGRLDYRQRRSGWAEALATAGAMLYAWPIGRRELPRWVEARMRRNGIEPDPGAVELLSARAEGNLLAAAQEIDKLRLLRGEGPVDTEAVREAVGDSARYDVFDLGDAAVGGDVPRVVRICRGLRGEGVEPTLVLWSLARDLRALAALQDVHRRRGSPDAVYREQRVPKPRHALLWRAATRAPAGAWTALVGRAARVDRVLKGAAAGRPWDELLQLGVEIAATAQAGAERR